jgi:hypothetical protein
MMPADNVEGMRADTLVLLRELDARSIDGPVAISSAAMTGATELAIATEGHRGRTRRGRAWNTMTSACKNSSGSADW